MKKIFALLMLFFINASHSDNLSEAIRASNKEEVLRILYTHKPNQKEILKYLDTAEQIIKFRRENIILDRQYDEELQGSDKWWARVGVASLAWFFISMIVGSNKTANNYGYENGFLAVSGAASLIGFAASVIAVISIKNKQMKSNYHHALSIKEMLYDYLNETSLQAD